MLRDKSAEFMRGHPTVFAHSSDPMDAEDWLRTVEREFAPFFSINYSPTYGNKAICLALLIALASFL